MHAAVKLHRKKETEKAKTLEVERKVAIHEEVRKDYHETSLVYKIISECITKLKHGSK